MFGDMVSVRDYSGAGMSSFEDLQQLRKALEPGYAITGQTGGAALRVQSLEGSLKVITYRSEHVKLWKRIPKSPAFSTTEEYNQVSGYGNRRQGPFVRAGELPPDSDSTYTRRTALVKYCGTTREIVHPMTLVNPAHGDVVALTTHDAILHLVGQIEKFMFTGDSSLAFSGEAEQFDGLDSLIDATAFVDLAGAPLQESDIQDAGNAILTKYGRPTDLFLGLRPNADFVKTLYPRLRQQMPAPVNGQAGLAINSMLTSAGQIFLNPDLFLNPEELDDSPPTAATSANAPEPAQTLTVSNTLAADTADWQKQLGVTTATTTFSYAVTCCNRYGESSPIYADRNLTAANVANQAAVRIDVTNAAAVGANPPEFLRIYRTRPNVTSTTPADFSLILQVAVTSQTSGAAMTSVAADRNFIIPFTHIGYMLQMDDTVLTFRQLAPVMKMDLAVIGPAYRFMVLMYGTPILFAPEKCVRLINIGEV